MSEPVAVPITPSAIKEALSSSVSEMPPQEHYLDDSTMNHLSYKATNKVPYIIDYFGLRDFYETNPVVIEMAKELHSLTVLDDANTPIADTKADLDLLMQELNLSENDAPFYKLKKALFMAKIRARQREMEHKKLQMLADTQIV